MPEPDPADKELSDAEAERLLELLLETNKDTEGVEDA